MHRMVRGLEANTGAFEATEDDHRKFR